MNIRSFVEGLDLRDGESQRMNCPACGGKNTFTVTNTSGSVVYNCYRLDCGIRGAAHVGLTAAEIKLKLSRIHEDTRKADIPTMVIPEYVTKPSADNILISNFRNKWQLQDVALLYDVKDRRAVFPIYHQGRVVDLVGRALDGKLPKWLRYGGQAPVYKSIRGRDKRVAVVVEDVISAHTVSSLVSDTTGLAILGTSLTADHMAILGEYDRVIVALDRDAAHKTLLYKRSIETWTGIEAQALLLVDDIKYRHEDDVEALRSMTT